MAIGIQTGMRQGSRRPPLTRATPPCEGGTGAQLGWQLVRAHRWKVAVFASGIVAALVLFAPGGDPLERAVRPTLDHVLRGSRYELTCLTEPVGPVLTRRAPRTVVITVYRGEPERLEQARRVAEAVLDPSCGDRVFVRSTDTWLLNLWDCWVGLAGAVAFSLLWLLGRRHQVFSRLRTAARRQPRPAPPPAEPAEPDPMLVDERLRLDVGPSVNLRALADQVERIREKLWSDLGLRLPPVRLRQRPENASFWQVWVRDRMVERFCPGRPVALEAWLARTFQGVAWELLGTQEVQSLIEPHAELVSRVPLLELTVVLRTLFHRGHKLRPLERVLTAVARQKDRHPELPLEALIERVSAELGGAR